MWIGQRLSIDASSYLNQLKRAIYQDSGSNEYNVSHNKTENICKDSMHLNNAKFNSLEFENVQTIYRCHHKVTTKQPPEIRNKYISQLMRGDQGNNIQDKKCHSNSISKSKITASTSCFMEPENFIENSVEEGTCVGEIKSCCQHNCFLTVVLSSTIFFILILVCVSMEHFFDKHAFVGQPNNSPEEEVLERMSLQLLSEEVDLINSASIPIIKWSEISFRRRLRNFSARFKHDLKYFENQIRAEWCAILQVSRQQKYNSLPSSQHQPIHPKCPQVTNRHINFMLRKPLFKVWPFILDKETWRQELKAFTKSTGISCQRKFSNVLNYLWKGTILWTSGGQISTRIPSFSTESRRVENGFLIVSLCIGIGMFGLICIADLLGSVMRVCCLTQKSINHLVWSSLSNQSLAGCQHRSICAPPHIILLSSRPPARSIHLKFNPHSEDPIPVTARSVHSTMNPLLALVPASLPSTVGAPAPTTVQLVETALTDSKEQYVLVSNNSGTFDLLLNYTPV